ncbi:MAG: Dabb family protein [Bacteroidales bacterium]|nr:Dabb family protein [Bacteroidales bacterium]
MTHHIILWKLKEDLTAVQKEEIKKNIKEGLESLAGRIPGLLNIKVNIEGLPSANVDLMLDSLFDSPESLKGYSVHPEHLAVANGRVRPFTVGRYCMDYED